MDVFGSVSQRFGLRTVRGVHEASPVWLSQEVVGEGEGSDVAQQLPCRAMNKRPKHLETAQQHGSSLEVQVYCGFGGTTKYQVGPHVRPASDLPEPMIAASMVD